MAVAVLQLEPLSQEQNAAPMAWSGVSHLGLNVQPEAASLSSEAGSVLRLATRSRFGMLLSMPPPSNSNATP